MSWHGQQRAGSYTHVKAATTAEQPFLVPIFEAVSTLELYIGKACHTIEL